MKDVAVHQFVARVRIAECLARRIVDSVWSTPGRTALQTFSLSCTWDSIRHSATWDGELRSKGCSGVVVQFSCSRLSRLMLKSQIDG